MQRQLHEDRVVELVDQIEYARSGDTEAAWGLVFLLRRELRSDRSIGKAFPEGLEVLREYFEEVLARLHKARGLPAEKRARGVVRALRLARSRGRQPNGRAQRDRDEWVARFVFGHELRGVTKTKAVGLAAEALGEEKGGDEREIWRILERSSFFYRYLEESVALKVDVLRKDGVVLKTAVNLVAERLEVPVEGVERTLRRVCKRIPELRTSLTGV